MKTIKHIIRKIIYKEDASSETLVNYLRSRGAEIGNDVTIYAPNKTVIDNNTLVAITLLIAGSNPKEKDVLVDLVMNFLRNDN